MLHTIRNIHLGEQLIFTKLLYQLPFQRTSPLSR